MYKIRYSHTACRLSILFPLSALLSALLTRPLLLWEQAPQEYLIQQANSQNILIYQAPIAQLVEQLPLKELLFYFIVLSHSKGV